MIYQIATELANTSARKSKKVGKMASKSRNAVSKKGSVTVVKGKGRASAAKVAGSAKRGMAAGPGRGAAC